MNKVFSEYKKFALKGNVVDMAIGIVIGGAFATIASSLVTNVISPVIGLFSSGVDLADLFVVLKNGVQGSPYINLEHANKDGAVTLSYGLFLNSVISFIIVSWFAFFIVKGINQVNGKEEKSALKPTKECTKCYSEINKKASVCPQCTSILDSKC